MDLWIPLQPGHLGPLSVLHCRDVWLQFAANTVRSAVRQLCLCNVISNLQRASRTGTVALDVPLLSNNRNVDDDDKKNP